MDALNALDAVFAVAKEYVKALLAIQAEKIVGWHTQILLNFATHCEAADKEQHSQVTSMG